MSYRSQLVIRTSDASGIEVLERVKLIAETESKTISDKAIELLAQALDGAIQAPAAQAAATQAAPATPGNGVHKQAAAPTVASAPAPAPVTAVHVELAERSESSVRRDPIAALAPPSAGAKDPKVRPSEAPQEAALRCVQLFGIEGANAAARALTPFFAAAEPVDGANIREELQERMTKTDYEALMDELKQTEEYREYRRRVVYASW